MSKVWSLEDWDKAGGKYKYSIFFSQIKGKEVISKDGERMGKVVDVVFSPTYFLGVVVKYKGKKYVIDKEYIYSYGDKIVLRERMLFSYLGKKVFNAEGEYVGKVVEIVRDKNGEFRGIVVRKGFSKREISKGKIKLIKTNIILR